MIIKKYYLRRKNGILCFGLKEIESKALIKNTIYYEKFYLCQLFNLGMDL